MIGGAIRKSVLALAVMLTVLSTGSFVFATDDIDGDGLPDDWEIHFFGNLDHEADGDFDGDGFTNLEESVAVTDPTDSLSKPDPPTNGSEH